MQQLSPRTSKPLQAILPVAGTWWVLALALIPLWGMLFAWQHNPTLFETPPLTLLGLLPLVLRTLGLAFCVSVGALLWEHASRLLMSAMITLVIGSSPCSVLYHWPFHRIFWRPWYEKVSHRARALGSLLGTESAFTGFNAAVLVLILSTTPYVQILVTAALQQTPASPDEAARTLGVTPWRRFLHLTLPRLRPTWAFALVIVAFYVISDFGAVAVLDCEVLTWALYQSRHAPADAMRMGFGLVFCTLPMLGMIRWLHGKQKPVKAISETRTLQRVPLPQALRLPLYLAHGFIIGLGLLLPLWHMTEWLVSGLKYAEQFATLGPTIQTTLIYTLVGAMLTLIAALYRPTPSAVKNTGSMRWLSTVFMLQAPSLGFLLRPVCSFWLSI